MTKKIDQKLVSQQDHEIKYLCSVWFTNDMKHLKAAVVKDIVKKIGRSRRAINAVLKYLGYHFDPRKKK